jgi:hypothetical protein
MNLFLLITLVLSVGAACLLDLEGVIIDGSFGRELLGSLMPEVDNDISIEIRPEDVKLDMFRAGGPGGHLHAAAVMSKRPKLALNLRDRVQAVVYTYETGLIQPGGKQVTPSGTPRGQATPSRTSNARIVTSRPRKSRMRSDGSRSAPGARTRSA